MPSIIEQAIERTSDRLAALVARDQERAEVEAEQAAPPRQLLAAYRAVVRAADFEPAYQQFLQAWGQAAWDEQVSRAVGRLQRGGSV